MKAFVAMIALHSICCLQGGSSESPSNDQSTADVESELRCVSNPGKYRLRNAKGGVQFNISLLVAELNSDDARIRIPAARGIPFDAPPEFKPAVEPLVAMLGNNSLERQN